MSKKVLLNYTDRSFRTARRLNSRTGLSVGGFDEVWERGPQDIDKAFVERNKAILSTPRGAGYYLWKPYLVYHTLRALSAGDWLFYCDAGAYFVSSIDALISTCGQQQVERMTFQLEHPEYAYTKRDVFVATGTDVAAITGTRQRLGGYQLWKVTPENIAFVRHWLEVAQRPGLITDEVNRLGLPNYDGFVGHWHDQSIFSVLQKQAGWPAFRDPSQYGGAYVGQYPRSTYPQLIYATRQRDVPLVKRVRRWLADRLKGRAQR